MSKRRENILIIALFVVGMVWGYGFVAVDGAMKAGFTPISVNMLRFALGAVLTAIFFPKCIKTLKLMDVKSGLLPSLLLALGFFLQNTAMQMSTPGNTALITGSYIILVPLFEAMMIRKRPRGLVIISAIITFTGLAILSAPSFRPDNMNFGDLLTFLAAVSFALHFFALDRALKVVDTDKMTFLQLFTMTIVFAILYMIFERGVITHVDPAGWYSIIFLGAFSSFFAYAIQTYAQKYVAPTKVAFIMATESLFGAVFSVMMGVEPLTIFLGIGGTIAFSGILLGQVPPKAKVVYDEQ